MILFCDCNVEDDISTDDNTSTSIGGENDDDVEDDLFSIGEASI